MTRILNTLSDTTLPKLLNSGQIGVLPTDTLYGLVCRADDKTAVARLYGLKSRDNKPGTVIARSTKQLIALGLKARYIKAVEQFWRNGLSIVIPSALELEYIHLGKRSVACRIIDAPTDLVTLLESCGPLLTTSANLAGQKPAVTIEEAQAYFGDQVDFYVEGGSMTGHKPSTVIRVVDDAVEVLREGAIVIDEETGRIS